MRAKITRLIKDKGILLPGIGLSSMTKIHVGQAIAPEYGGGEIADLEIDGPLILVYKKNPDGSPCKTFGKDVDGVALTADGVAFPAHACKAFLFTRTEQAQQGQQRGK